MRQRRGGLFAWGLVALACTGISICSLAQEAASFSSVFDVAVATDPSAAWHLDLSVSLTAVYEQGGWSVASQSLFDDSGWIRQWFQSRLGLGSVMGTAEMTLLPSTAELETASLMVEMYAFGLQLDAGLTIEPDGAGGWVGLVGHDVAGIPVGLELWFGVDNYHNLIQTGCAVAFTGASAWTEFPVFPCCPDVSIRPEVTFSDAGFVSAEADFRITEIPSLPWLSLVGTLTYELDEKTLQISPSISGGVFTGCIDVGLSLSGGAPNEIDEILIGILRFNCEIAGIEFSSETRLDGGSWARMYLRGIESHLPGGYFEFYRIQSADEGCCGPLEFELVAYFLEGGAQLLDLSAMQAQFMLQVVPLFTIGSAMEFDFEQAAGSQWVYWDIFAQVSF